MQQLIINGVYLPEVKRGRYKCYPDTLASQVDMISGRRVQEIRGTVWRIEYEVEYLEDSIYSSLLSALRSGSSLTVTFLPDNLASGMQTSTFLLDKAPLPTFACSVDGEAKWYNVAFSLREVKPHD